MNVTREQLEEFMTKFNEHDMNWLKAKVHTDIVIRNLDTNTIIADGRDAVVDFYTKNFEKGGSTNSILDLMTMGNKIVFKEHMIESTGEEHDDFNMMEFEDGLLKRVWYLME